MSYKIRVTWANALDKHDTPEMILERDAKMLAMITAGQIIQVINSKSTYSGNIEFTTMQDAEEWKTFIEGLATKYNKTIVSIEIT